MDNKKNDVDKELKNEHEGYADDPTCTDSGSFLFRGKGDEDSLVKKMFYTPRVPQRHAVIENSSSKRGSLRPGKYGEEEDETGAALPKQITTNVLPKIGSTTTIGSKAWAVKREDSLARTKLEATQVTLTMPWNSPIETNSLNNNNDKILAKKKFVARHSQQKGNSVCGSIKNIDPTGTKTAAKTMFPGAGAVNSDAIAVDVESGGGEVQQIPGAMAVPGVSGTHCNQVSSINSLLTQESTETGLDSIAENQQVPETQIEAELVELQYADIIATNGPELDRAREAELIELVGKKLQRRFCIFVVVACLALIGIVGGVVVGVTKNSSSTHMTFVTNITVYLVIDPDIHLETRPTADIEHDLLAATCLQQYNLIAGLQTNCAEGRVMRSFVLVDHPPSFNITTRKLASRETKWTYTVEGDCTNCQGNSFLCDVDVENEFVKRVNETMQHLREKDKALGILSVDSVEESSVLSTTSPSAVTTP